MVPAITADGLTKIYGVRSSFARPGSSDERSESDGDTVAVRDLDLEIAPGTVYGFLGPNGAGKTTTMRLLTTLTEPTSGTASVAGVSIDDRDALVDHIGYLPEEPPIFDELTGREQLEYAAGIRELPASSEDRIEELLARFDLTDDADRRIEGYSTGMRKKVGLIQTVLHEPEVAFLDEPTSGLDPRAARTVRDTIAELAEGEMTVFLSTHILPVVDELADTVGVLHGGELVAEDAPAALKRAAESGEERSLEDAFLEVTQDRSEEPIEAAD